MKSLKTKGTHSLQPRAHDLRSWPAMTNLRPASKLFKHSPAEPSDEEWARMVERPKPIPDDHDQFSGGIESDNEDRVVSNIRLCSREPKRKSTYIDRHSLNASFCPVRWPLPDGHETGNGPFPPPFQYVDVD